MELFTIDGKPVSISPEAIEAGKSALGGVADAMVLVTVILAVCLSIGVGVFWIMDKRRS